MASSTSLTLFGGSSVDKPAQMKAIPVLSLEQRNNLFAGKTVNARFSYLYNPDAPERHYKAQVLAQALYHLGATLINTGRAYHLTDDLVLIENGMIRDMACETSLTDKPVLCTDLLKKYANLPCFKIRNGNRLCASNPLHAVFMAKVALDHLPPEMIYQWYVDLKEQSNEMSIGISTLDFPNGSQFLGEHAVSQLLQSYLISNLQEKFRRIIDESTQHALLTSTNFFDTSYFELVGVRSKEDYRPLVHELMKLTLGPIPARCLNP